MAVPQIVKAQVDFRHASDWLRFWRNHGAADSFIVSRLTEIGLSPKQIHAVFSGDQNAYAS